MILGELGGGGKLRWRDYFADQTKNNLGFPHNLGYTHSAKQKSRLMRLKEIIFSSFLCRVASKIKVRIITIW